MKYTISVTRPNPSMNRDRYEIDAVDFDDAVRQTRQMWIEAGRFTSLSSCGYTWYWITPDGEVTNRNVVVER